MKRVFIDGSAGTTGLRIHDRISMRKDLEILTLSEETRKDAGQEIGADLIHSVVHRGTAHQLGAHAQARHQSQAHQ